MCVAGGSVYLSMIQESGLASGGSEGLDRSSGRGMYSSLSVGGNSMRPAFQSALACSIRSLRDETKFHQMYLSPRGSPPSSNRVAALLATITGLRFLANTGMWPMV